MDNINKLTQLNAEIEGLLHVLSRRDNEHIRKLIYAKFEDFVTEFTYLLDRLNKTPLAAAEEALAEEVHQAAQEEVKEQEAVSDEVEDEMDVATDAIERGELEQNDMFSNIERDVPSLEECDSCKTENALVDETIETSNVTDVASENGHELMQETTGNNGTDDVPQRYDDDEIVEISLGEFWDEEPVNTTEDVDNSVVKPEEDVKENVDVEQKVDNNNLDYENNVESAPEVPKEDDVQENESTEEISVDQMLARREAVDLKRVFTLNDKFRFRRALFNQDDAEFSKTLDLLATMTDFETARNYLSTNCKWDMSNPDVEDFMSIIKPHYLK